MSSVTTNLNLVKPDNNDYVDVAVINSNYDIIDDFAGTPHDYLGAINKPKINSVELNGDKNSSDLGLADEEHEHTIDDITDFPTIPEKMTDLVNDAYFVSDQNYVHTDNNFTTAEKTQLSNLQGSMSYKGTLGTTHGETHSLPSASLNNGSVYKVVDEYTYNTNATYFVVSSPYNHYYVYVYQYSDVECTQLINQKQWAKNTIEQKPTIYNDMFYLNFTGYPAYEMQIKPLPDNIIIKETTKQQLPYDSYTNVVHEGSGSSAVYSSGNSITAHPGDIFISNGTDWVLIPSGNDEDKADKVSNATSGHLAGLDATGNLTDSGKSVSDLAIVNEITYAEYQALTTEEKNDGTPRYVKDYPIPTQGGLNYSTIEQLTGQKWIDGRDIYQKTFETGTLPNNTTSDVIIDDDIDIILNIEGFATSEVNPGYIRTLPFVGGGSNDIRIDKKGTGFIQITTFSNWTTYSGYVTLKYIKTEEGT